jgi:bifunctional pyridoxal-dependent enzyme with beta-cystathionase and maltose regulon repressor activities
VWRAYPADVLPLWVAEMDVSLAPPVAAALHAAIDAGDTGYPAWLDCRALGLHDSDTATENHIVSDLAGPARMFLDRARVAVSSGHVFGRGGAGFVRLNFGTSPAILRGAIQRMGDAARAQGQLDPRRAPP